MTCRRFYFGIGIAVGLWVALAVQGFSQQVAAPKTQEASLLVPPQQTQPWTAPATKLPSVVVSAMEALFKNGLADPRGCEYREIEVLAGGPAPIATHGWVMPGQGESRFAVCWNGLVYPVTKVGNRAEVKADMDKLLQAESAKKSERNFFGGDVSSDSVTLDYLSPTQAALLLRANYPDLAEAVWTQAFAGHPEDVMKDPYLELSADFAWAVWSRAVAAHMTGDNPLSLASAQMLASMQQTIETEAAARGLVRPMNSSNTPRTMPYLNFLDQLPALIADEQIRLQEPPHTPVLSSDPQPQGAERMAGLIRDLELVSARQMAFPGGVNLMDDPVVLALVKEGEPAVEPLIKCLEEDARLTRSLQMFRPWVRTGREIIPVNKAAFVALIHILHTTQFGDVSHDDLSAAENRKALGEKIWDYWQKNKGLTLQDQWYQVLSDDKATPAQWVEAAKHIVTATDMDLSVSDNGWVRMPNRQSGVVPAMRGESLRAKANPSVSDLLLKRMNDLSAPMHQYPDTNLRSKLALGLVLAKWDGKAHFADLKSLSDILVGKFSDPNRNGQSSVNDVQSILQARIDAGDPQSLADYAAWIVTVPRDRRDIYRVNIFEVLWQHPSDPSIGQAAEKLFAAKDATWVPLLGKNSHIITEMILSPLVGLPAFRTELLRGLSDTSAAGMSTLDKEGRCNLVVTNAWGGSRSDLAVGDPLAPPADTQMPFRVCDLYAYLLSELDGAPNIRLYWPEAKRDEAIKACVVFLQRYGDLFQYQPGGFNAMNPSEDKATLHFPQLDHTATQEDVDHNRAIFTLTGKSRLWKMPAFPLKATWTILKDRPGEGQVGIGEGRVVQAEEVLVNGKWERFYGFIGRYHMDKVPAAEIEFEFEPQWGWITAPGFEGKVTGPGKIELSETGLTLPKVQIGEAVPFTLKFRNKLGVDQALPAALTPPAPDGKSIPWGVTLELFYTKDTISSGMGMQSLPEWTPVPRKTAKSTAPATPTAATGELLRPGQEVTATSLDVRDLFDVSKPGTYRLHASAPTDKEEEPMMMLNDALFVVEEKAK